MVHTGPDEAAEVRGRRGLLVAWDERQLLIASIFGTEERRKVAGRAGVGAGTVVEGDLARSGAEAGDAGAEPRMKVGGVGRLEARMKAEDVREPGREPEAGTSVAELGCQDARGREGAGDRDVRGRAGVSGRSRCRVRHGAGMELECRDEVGVESGTGHDVRGQEGAGGWDRTFMAGKELEAGTSVVEHCSWLSTEAEAEE